MKQINLIIKTPDDCPFRCCVHLDCVLTKKPCESRDKFPDNCPYEDVEND